MIKSLLENIFSISDADYSHRLIKILGIKIRLIKPENKKRITVDYSQFGDISQLPCAQGFLREYQLGLLCILKEFDKVCTSNGVRYWLSGGTLLGAKRHKGFIPWDDDCDVDMMRTDYEKFADLFNEKTSNPDLYCQFWRDKTSNATCILKIKHKKIKQLFLDIFPHDFYIKDVRGKEKTNLNKKIRFIRKWLSLNPFRISDDEKLREKFKYLTEHVINEDKVPDEYNNPSIHWGFDFPHRWNNWIYDYEQIFPLSKIEFEGHEFCAPANVDFMLKNIYGNYMQLPKSICPHHTDEKAFTPEEIEELHKLVEKETHG